MNFRRTKAIARKEMLHILRDPRSLFAALMQPLVMLLIFGWALSLDVDRIPTYVYDMSHTPQSREVIRGFNGSKYFSIKEEVHAYHPIEEAINRRDCLVGIVIPEDFGRKIGLQQPTSVQILLDGSDSNTAAIAMGYAEGVVNSYSQELQVPIQTRSGSVAPTVSPEVRVWYNPDLLSSNFIVPGLVVVIVMIIASNLGSLTIAREWENGTMEQLLSTPVRPTELVLGKLLAYFALGLADMLISIIVGVFIFQVPFRGNVWFLLLTSCLFLFGALSWGIFLSATARTQLMAYQMGMLSSFLPGYLLSGFIYSIPNMPRVIQLVSYIVPARYFVTILNGIFLKGVAFRVLWLEVLMLSIYAGLVFWGASRRMRLKVA